jgi:hypothetical protein
MEIKLKPTNRLHLVKPAKAGNLCYARLWIGTMENGDPVQALIFGLALEAEAGIAQADMELEATAPPEDLLVAWPRVVTVSSGPGAYTPPWNHPSDMDPSPGTPKWRKN